MKNSKTGLGIPPNRKINCVGLGISLNESEFHLLKTLSTYLVVLHYKLGSESEIASDDFSPIETETLLRYFNCTNCSVTKYLAIKEFVLYGVKDGFHYSESTRKCYYTKAFRKKYIPIFGGRESFDSCFINFIQED